MPKQDPAKKPKNNVINLPTVARNTASLTADFASFSESEEYAKVLYYGPEGSGKTVGALTMAKRGKVLLINAEAGIKRRALAKMEIPMENISVWPKPEDRSKGITIAGLQAVYNRVKADLEADVNSWYGVVFDSDTEITQALTAQVSEQRIDRARTKGAEITDVDEFFTDLGDYNPMTKAFTDLIRKFRDLPVHVVHCALERKDVDKQTAMVQFGPAVTPGVSIPLLGYNDFVLAMRAEEIDNPFRARTKKGGRYRTKDRDGILPVILANPTMERIIDYLNETIVEAQDPDQALIKEPTSGKKKKPVVIPETDPVSAEKE